MNRRNQIILIVSFVPFCWLTFMATHELGHVLAGVFTGGSVNKVVIHPLTISRTDIAPNPSPLITVWSGPLMGVTVPLLVWIMFLRLKMPGDYLVRFFAGFCLIGNGAYIGFGSFFKFGDAGDMINHGSPVWLLWIFGTICVPLGFWLWHGIGSRFGLGEARGYVNPIAAYLSLILFLLALLGTLIFSPRI